MLNKNSCEEERIEIQLESQPSEENIIKKILFICSSIAIIFILFIIVFLFISGGAFFLDVGIFDFLFGIKWDPTNFSSPEFGALSIISGTFLVAFGTMIISVPLGIATAIYIAELAPSNVKKYLKGAVELLSGIPSVVFGFFGLVVFNVLLREIFNLTTGNTWFSGSVILAIMALPTIVSVSEDAITAVPKEYREASLAMGGTQWQTIKNTVLPAAMSGITAAIILGMGRAIGETMAVIMVTGNCAILPEPITNMFSPIRTITGTIAIEMGEVPVGSLHYKALFALGIVLFFITFGINTLANIILSRLKEKFIGRKKEKRIHIVIPKKVKKKKKLIQFLILFILIFWVLLTWIDWFLTILISFGIICVCFGYKKLSTKNIQKIIFGVIKCSMILVISALSIIIGYIVIRGIPAMTLEFLTQPPRNLGRKGGIFPAIIGTLFLVVGSILFAVPIGMGAGIYLSEYAKENKIHRIIRSGIDNLNGTPSIIFGLFGFAFFVLFLDFGISLIAGQLTLSLMILPTIIKTTEEAIKSVPKSLREGSLALGSTKWQSINRVVLPVAIPGIITGIILGMGRVAGETAPIIWTCVVFAQKTIPFSPLDSVSALTYHLFILTTAVTRSDVQAAGTALVLLILVMIFYCIAIYIRNYYQKKITW